MAIPARARLPWLGRGMQHPAAELRVPSLPGSAPLRATGPRLTQHVCHWACHIGGHTNVCELIEFQFPSWKMWAQQPDLDHHSQPGYTVRERMEVSSRDRLVLQLTKFLCPLSCCHSVGTTALRNHPASCQSTVRISPASQSTMRTPPNISIGSRTLPYPSLQ